jgi:hypothetical protein
MSSSTVNIDLNSPGTTRPHEAGAGTVGRSIDGPNAGSTPARGSTVHTNTETKWCELHKVSAGHCIPASVIHFVTWKVDACPFCKIEQLRNLIRREIERYQEYGEMPPASLEEALSDDEVTK